MKGGDYMKVKIRATGEHGTEVVIDGKKMEQVLSYSIRFSDGRPILLLEIDDPELDISLKAECNSDGFNQFVY